jgi:mRNA interferase MazF
MRGDVYETRDNPHAKGHEQQGRRYAVILQSDTLPISTVIAAPTSASARDSSYRPEIQLMGRRTKVLIEQMRCVDPEQRLGRKVGKISFDELAGIDRAVKLVLGLF